MKKIKELLAPLSLILLIPIVNIIYTYLNNSSRGFYSLVTDIDRAVPFVKAFAIPYLIWFPFIVGTLIYLCFRYRKVYYRTIISLILGLLTCYVVYYFFQTTVPRPELTGDDTLTSLIRYIYNSDNPFNCFPSIHVLTSYLLIKAIRSCKNSISAETIIIISISILIIMSTQFIKQHVILDLIFAILIDEVIFRAVGSLSFIKNFRWESKKAGLYVPKNNLNLN